MNENTGSVPVQVPYLDGSVSLLKVNEGVVFELLDTLQFAKLREGLLQQLLCDRRGQLTHKQHLDLMGQTIIRRGASVFCIQTLM